MKLIICTLIFITNSAFGHGGRTDSSGCHHDRKNGGYHCHWAEDKKTVEAIRNPANFTPPPTKKEIKNK